MKTSIFDDFCAKKNGYSRSITLRNRLVPIGKTEEYINNFLGKDEMRAEFYPEVKDLIDILHKQLIEQSLSSVSFNWIPLFDQFELFQNEKNREKKIIQKKELENLQKAARSHIAKSFSSNENFEKIFKNDLFKELLPNLLEKLNLSEEQLLQKKERVAIFKDFTSYFSSFNTKRKNIYSEEAKNTAISYRIVNINFPKFFENVKLFKYLETNFPEIIADTENSLSDFLNGKKLKDYFSVDSYNNVLSQNNIDFYNTIIGGFSVEVDSGTKKIQGLNEMINLKRQQLPAEEHHKLNKKMIFLFKQILSDKKSFSFIPTGFTDSNEVYDSVKNFDKEIFENVTKEIEVLFSLNKINLEEIYVEPKNLNKFSSQVFGSWSLLLEGLFLKEKDFAKKSLSENQEEKLRKEISKNEHNLHDLQMAYERYLSEYDKIAEKSCVDFFTVTDLLNNISNKFSKIDFNDVKDLQQDKKSINPIKNYLDAVKELFDHLKLIEYNGEEKKDTNFYSKLDEILSNFSVIIPLYNKVRNFVTKTLDTNKKIKLNFDSPKLASGWDKNKEQDNNSIILRKNGKYYLAILNPKKKPNFANIESSGSEEYYEKMVYKLLPGANKMLPKVFFSAKGKEMFCPSEQLLEDYKAGKHKKGEMFDKKYLHQLIDWFKDSISQHKDWSQFNFKFSPTESYEDISGFYNEVESQGYKITFVKIDCAIIDNLVESGSLLLFQIYNKDFSDKSFGNKNLHTMYFEHLFSEENLTDLFIKLNGNAEVFLRKASINKNNAIVHKKGSVLVNRTTSDGNQIPEKIYHEIYKYKNNMSKSMSEEAEALLNTGKVICKVASHDIIKDKHYTEDMYLFYCPITINFKARDRSRKEFNNQVVDLVLKNNDVKILGIDRGENHLIYLTLINQKGEIELQKSLNLIEVNRSDKKTFVNYQKKLVDKEVDRDTARKNWQTIDNITKLKEGYLSYVVHEIVKIMIENNAIIVMEDLSSDFKRERFAIERQIYQKFENMLINKLNYLVFKDRLPNEAGGVLNGYQLTNKIATLSEVYKQCGFIFYVNPAYTTKVCPKTGFPNLFITKGLTNIKKKKDFFSKFYSLRYDLKEGCFVFAFNYNKIYPEKVLSDREWEIYTKGERFVYDKNEHCTICVNPTEEIGSILSQFNISWKDGENNILDELMSVKDDKSNAKLFDVLLRMFNVTLQMKNYNSNNHVDYLCSPVKAFDKTFFDSREQLLLGDKATLPICPVANNAYHVALKGLYLVQNNFNRNKDGVICNILHEEWFDFLVNRFNK